MLTIFFMWSSFICTAPEHASSPAFAALFCRRVGDWSLSLTSLCETALAFDSAMVLFVVLRGAVPAWVVSTVEALNGRCG